MPFEYVISKRNIQKTKAKCIIYVCVELIYFFFYVMKILWWKNIKMKIKEFKKKTSTIFEEPNF